MKPPSGPLETFDPPAVKDVPIENWEGNSLGIEPSNLTVIRSMIAYGALDWRADPQNPVGPSISKCERYICM